MTNYNKGWVGALFILSLLTPQLTLAAYHPKSVKSQNYGKKQVCTCLAYAKAVTGKYPPAASAMAILANRSIRKHKTPKIGAIALMYSPTFPAYGHSAAVIGISKTQVRIAETGWAGCNTITRRWIPKSSVVAYHY